MYKRFFKRVLDIFFAIMGIVLLFPVLIVFVFLFYFDNHGNPFFIQRRPGKNRVVFKIIKFKTMNEKTDMQGSLLLDEQRLTTIGVFLRKFSLDELPQLFNVLIGNMSIVGPRPLLTDYAHLYSDFQNRRHEVKPGITGWTQINGRNALHWDKRFEYDVWYVDHLSFALDMRIIFKTLRIVLKSDGINAADADSIEPFNEK